MLIVAGALVAGPDGFSARVPLDAASEVDLAAVVRSLREAGGYRVEVPPGPVRLPMAGLAGPLTRGMLGDTLGPDADLAVEGGALVIRVAAAAASGDSRADFERRVGELARRAAREAERRRGYGFRALDSYRPNDPNRPTICLIHGLNSTSSVFRHMVGPLEAAGFGVVAYDFAYNQDLDRTSADFARDWPAFRRERGEGRPWAIVAHSMGSLLARSYVEDDASYAGDVSDLILIAPPNRGSTLSRAQTLLQMIQGVRAMRGGRRSDPMAVLGDGLGRAADDMLPGSAYLARLDGRGRRAGVRYRILAGDEGYIAPKARAEAEARLGLTGGIGRAFAAGASGSLDEITDGLGDGCVSVASTRLDGVAEHRTLHANHLELIRAPLLFADPGPVPSIPPILEWLGRPAPAGR